MKNSLYVFFYFASQRCSLKSHICIVWSMQPYVVHILYDCLCAEDWYIRLETAILHSSVTPWKVYHKQILEWIKLQQEFVITLCPFVKQVIKKLYNNNWNLFGIIYLIHLCLGAKWEELSCNCLNIKCNWIGHFTKTHKSSFFFQMYFFVANTSLKLEL